MKNRDAMIDRVHMFMCDHQITFKYAKNSRELATLLTDLFYTEEPSVQTPGPELCGHGFESCSSAECRKPMKKTSKGQKMIQVIKSTIYFGVGIAVGYGAAHFILWATR